jgi:hypothetical protein
MPAGEASVLFEVTSIWALPAAVDLVVERGTYPGDGALLLEFSHDLFSRWQEAWGAVKGGTVVPSTSRIEITDPVAATVVGLPLGVRETQKVRMHLNGSPSGEFELYITEQIEGDVVGGMTYRSGIPWTVYLPLVLRNTP